MTIMIQDYYLEYCGILKQLRLDPSQSKALVADAKALLQQMTLEARELFSSDVREEWMERIQLYSNQLELLQQEAERAILLDRTPAGSKSADNNTDALLSRQYNALEEAKRTLAETEELAGSIIENLHDNRSTLESSRQRISSLQALTEQAHTITKSLNKPWWKKF
jgi:multidrug resistance efflux pump